MKLKDLFATPEHTQVKLAVETPDNQQVEQDFGRLAYAFLKDRAPALLPFLIGFEVVDQEPDGSRAVGIFGFRINDNFYYVPAFFLSNQIKGMDMLFSKKDKQFIPLREGWINHLISRQVMTLGDRAPKHAEENFRVPDFTFISKPPLGGSTKLADALTETVIGWNMMQDDTVSRLDNDEKFATAFASAVAVLEKEADALKTAGPTPLTEYLANHGGPEAVNTVLRTFEDINFLKAASVFYDYTDLMITEFSETLKPKIAQSKVRVVTKEEVRDYTDDGVKYRVVRDGFAVVDDRDPEEKSTVYDVDYLTSVGNPNQSGTYRMIMQTGATVPVCVIKAPYGVSHFGTTLVIDPKTGRYFQGPNKDIHIREDMADMDKDDNPLYENAVNISDMEIGKVYVLVNANDEGSLPFRAKGTTQVGGELTKIKVDWLTHKNCMPDYHGDSYSEDSYYKETSTGNGYNPARVRSYGDSCLIPMDRGGELKKSKDDVIVPVQSWKAFELEDDRDREDDGPCCVGEDDTKGFRPASYLEVVDNLTKLGFHDVHIESRDQGLEYNFYVDGLPSYADPMPYKTAMVRLVQNFGFSPEEAEGAIKEAADSYKAKRYVLFPNQFQTNPPDEMDEFLPKSAQVVMPPFPPQNVAYDEQINVPVQPAQFDYVTGQSYGIQQPQNVGPGSGANIGGEGMMQQQQGGLPQDVNSLAQNAAASGQQQVFDHAVIGGLAKTYDTSAAIDSYIPELTNALDRVGRILFLFYWKNEDFAERYGDQDLTGLEDHIRAVFKSLGDLVLNLKQKTIDAEESEYVTAE